MKKMLLVGLMLLALAATAQAQEAKLDFRASGFIDAISEMWKNNYGTEVVNNGNSIYNVVPAKYQPFGPVGSTSAGYMFNSRESYMESRLRLKFDAVYGKELTGTIFFEADSANWGDLGVASNNRLSDRNGYGYWSGDRAALEIKNIYVNAALPYMGIPLPMQVQIGLQSLSIRPNLFVYTDGMGVVGTVKIDPLNVQGIWFKALEGRTQVADDVDVWGAHVNAKVGTFTIGGYGLYYNMDTYPLNAFTTVPFVDSTYKAGIGWYGLYADGKLGPFDVNFDVIWDHGKVTVRDTYQDPENPRPDVKYNGWALYGKADYPIDVFNLGVVAWWGSGSDTHKTGPSGLPGSLTSTGDFSHKVESAINPPGSESGAVFGESLVMYSNWIDRGTGGIANNLNYNQVARGPIGGTWAAKVYGMYKVTPWYKITLNALYIGDTTSHGDTFGTSRDLFTGNLKDNTTIGWEVDLYNEFQIYKQLKFWACGGAMWTGDAYKFFDPVFERNRKPSTPWTIMTNLTYTF